MIKPAFPISRRILGIIMLVSFGLTSCYTGEIDDLPEPDDQISDYVRIGASVKANIVSRGYKPSGPVSEGVFCLTYPFSQSVAQGDTTYTYKLADVKFGTSGAETMGFVTYPDKDGKIVDLKWSDVTLRKGTPGTAVFYLDNVSPALNDSDLSNGKDDDVVRFRAGEDIPFQAGEFDKVQGSNDLLWGTAEATKNAKKVDFILHHNMSRVRVVINVKPREDNGTIVDLSHVAKMEITNLHLKPESFDRTTGNLILPLEPEETLFPLVDIDDPANENRGTILWESVVDDDTVEENENTWKAKIYTTHDFVLPPQDLVNDSGRPKLRVTIPAEYAGRAKEEGDVVFEASLPQNMYASESDTADNDDGDDMPVSSNRRPMPLSFMKEHILTINATIGPPEMELQFAPVYVEDWNDMGEHSITGQQAGIYNNDDFFAFLNCYKRGDKVLLEKYGYKNGTDDDGNDKWIIMFWSRTIDVQYDEIKDFLKNTEDPGQPLHPDIPFSFSFNNYVLKVSGWPGYGNEVSGAAGQIRLYNLITGSSLAEPGITSLDDFKDMMAGYGAKNSSKMQKYGAYNNTDEQWVFEFTQDAAPEFELKYEDIHGMMNGDTGAGNFAINFRGHTVKVTGLPDGNDIVLSGAEGETLLHAILAAPEGIYSIEDIDWLIRAYNSAEAAGSDVTYPGTNATGDISWILGLYGKEDGTTGKWTFTFRRSLELRGPAIYATMVPDREKGKPDYSFAQASGLTVKVGDSGTTTYLYTPGMDNLRKLFAAGGQIKTRADLNNAVTYANNGNPIYRRFYGRYNEAERIWEYPITGSFEVSYSDIFGKLNSSADLLELILVDETKVTVTGMAGGENLICRGKQGAGILLSILRGSYKSEIPDPGIETRGDFTDLFAAYNGNNPADMQLYGNYIETESKWVFGFTPTAAAQIEVSYGDIYGKMNPESGAGDFAFDFGDRTVKVTGLPGGGDIVLSGAEGETLLHTLVTAPQSITSIGELNWLIRAYNNPDESWIFGLFGTQESSGGWKFVFGSRLRLNGPDIYSRMIPDAGSGKPDYEFIYTSGTGIQVADGTVTESVSSANLTRLFAESGNIASAEDLANMISAANSGNPVQRRYYGRFNGTGWSYTIAGSLNIASDIFGTLAEDVELRFADNNITVSVNKMPPGYRPVVCEGAEGPETLHKILRGTYPKPDPGIEDEADFAALKAAYNAGRQDDMQIYGSYAGGAWAYIVRKPLRLAGQDVYGAMVPSGSARPDYTFTYASGATVTIADGSTEQSVDVGQLKTLLAESGKVTTSGEFDAMITAAKGNNPVLRRYYGRLNGAKWLYPIAGSFSIGYNSAKGALASADDFDLSIAGGAKVTVTGLPGDRQVVCENNAGAQTLHDILRGTYVPRAGIEAEGDIARLITAYGSNSEDMKVYGTETGGSWTFTFYTSMTLEGSQIYGKMKSGADYVFAFDSGVEVKVNDGVTENVTGAQLKTLFAESGKVTALGEFNSMIAAANGSSPVVRRYYGRLSGTKWIYPITGTFSVAYDDIKGRLTSADPIEFDFEDGARITVTGLQYEYDDIVCSDAESAAVLYSILRGTHTLEPPQTGGGDAGGDTDPDPQP